MEVPLPEGQTEPFGVAAPGPTALTPSFRRILERDAGLGENGTVFSKNTQKFKKQKKIVYIQQKIDPFK